MIVASGVLTSRASVMGYILIGSYQRDHGQSLSKAHRICNNTAPERRRLIPLMVSSDLVNEAL